MKFIKVKLIVAKFFNYSVVFVLGSCASLKYPTNTSFFSGTLKSCNIDSTEVLNSQTLVIVDTDSLNSNCTNRIKYGRDIDKIWPINFGFDFKLNEYWYMFNPTPNYENGKIKSVLFSSHVGDLKLNKKTNTLVLKSIEFSWQKSYKYSYDKSTKTFVLMQIK